jgi:hypothetical protein
MLLLGACSGGGQNGAAEQRDTLAGSLPEILAAVLDGANAALGDTDQLGASFEDEVTADSCQGMLGLTPEEFEQYVEGAYASNAAIITFAHEVALIKCKDFDAAAEVKRLAAAGFDSGKWICVSPDQGYVIDSGSYVLLVATSTKGADAIRQSFEEAAGGNVGEADVFFEL